MSNYLTKAAFEFRQVIYGLHAPEMNDLSRRVATIESRGGAFNRGYATRESFAICCQSINDRPKPEAVPTGRRGPQQSQDLKPISDITSGGSAAREGVALSRATLCAGSNVRGGH